jgi:predicted HTH domain antitoxin
MTKYEGTMKAQASRSYEWALPQLMKLREQQPDVIDQAIHQLVEHNEDIRWSVIVGAYQDGRINLGKAAELLEVSELELRHRFITLGIPLRSGSQDLMEAQAEVDAVRAWFADTKDES